MDDRVGLLVIRAVISSNLGVYFCEALCSTSTVTETIELRVGGGPPPLPPGPPQVSISPQILRLTAGQPAQLEGSAQGSPPPRQEWSGGRCGRLEPGVSVVDGTLAIGAVRKAHEAQYTCISTSPAGSSSFNTVIYVSEPEPLGEVQPEQMSVRPGQPVRVTCRARDPAATVSWRAETGRLPQKASTLPGELTVLVTFDL